MSIDVKTYTGTNALPYLSDLARLRIEVFREFPYLYDGSVASEEEYLTTFSGSEESIFVVAFADGKVVGVSTGIPMREQPFEVRQPWEAGGYNIEEIYYFSESVLLPSFRGQGVGIRFFKEREHFARRSGYKMAVFCSVVRREGHPLQPEPYYPLDSFWRKRRYLPKEGYQCTMTWKQIDTKEEVENTLQFWYKTF